LLLLLMVQVLVGAQLHELYLVVDKVLVFNDLDVDGSDCVVRI